MRYRLLVNLGRKIKAGAIVTAEDLGADRLRQLDDQGFLEVCGGDLDEPAERSAFDVALEAWRLHMGSAQPLIITLLDETRTDDQVVALADALSEASTALPLERQTQLQEFFQRAAELAEADLRSITNTKTASVSTAALEGAAGMDAAPDHTASAADLAADATRGVAQSVEHLAHNQDVGGSNPLPAPNPEGGALAAASVVTTSEAQTVASPDGAAAATAASNDTPSADDGAAKKSPAAKRGGPKKSGAA